jgi:4'-phosphopantetheinyl transferase EntD
LIADADRAGHPAIPAFSGWLRGWLPPGCGVAAGPITARNASEFAAEEQLIARALSHRRHEFRAGRAVARQALAQLGCAPMAILAHPQRDPIWPQGFLGSITHCERLALAIAAPASLIQAIGVDLEDDAGLDPRLVPMVCRADETAPQHHFAQLGIDHAKLCFVAKEAAFKAIFPQQRRAFGFDRLRVCFDIPDRSFRVLLGCDPGEALTRLAGIGRFMSRPGFLVAAFVVPHPADQVPCLTSAMLASVA